MNSVMRFRRYFLIAVALFAVLAFGASASFGQMANRPVRPVLCPNPVTITLSAQAPTPGFGGKNINTQFHHTFQWKMADKCCQYLSGSVTIKYVALQGGPAGSATSANDLAGVTGLPSVKMFPNGATTGQTGSITIPLTAAFLATLGTSLTIGSEDDSSITSATLTLSACCLKNGIRT